MIGSMVVERKSTKREIILIAIILATLFILIGWAGSVNQTDNPEAIITFDPPEGKISFKCEVADTQPERAKGLMNRESLDSDRGMLFIFESSENVSFWMKNTLIPLDIIFIDEFGKVVNIAQANPEPGVNDAATHGILPGSSVSIDLN
jgi:uncharacterized membrane protein (UPF0127 family)